MGVGPLIFMFMASLALIFLIIIDSFLYCDNVPLRLVTNCVPLSILTPKPQAYQNRHLVP